MFIKMVPIILYYALLIIYLKVFKKSKSFLFCLAFSFLNVFAILNGYISEVGDNYTISYAICFTCALIFNFKELIVILIFSILGIIFNVTNLIQNPIVPEILCHIFCMFLGYFLNNVLYKKNKINPFSSIVYTSIIASFYAIVYLVDLAIFEKKEVMVNYDLEYYKYVFVFAIILFIALLIIYFFDNKSDEEKNTLLHIFIKKFRVLLIIIFFCIVFINNRFFNLYITNKNFDLINQNLLLVKTAIDNIESEFGENSLNNNPNTIEYVSGWDVGSQGAIYIYNEKFELLNNYYDDIVEGIIHKDINADGFKNIINYEQDKIIKCCIDEIEVFLKYVHYRNYYIVVFIPTEEINNDISVITYLTSYAIIVVMLSLFLLVYYIMKEYIAIRIQKTNVKLQDISNGNYDIYFDDNSSKEFDELSIHINKMLGALKNTINEIKDKNKQELELAKKIQESQLRTDDIKHIAYDISAKNIPAEEVGGDFYDYFYVDYRHIIFLIADVAGKGIPGAMFMIKAKNAIVNFAKQKLSLEEIVKRTNESLCQNNVTMMFVTSFIGLLDLRTGLLKYINCGHNAPILSIKKNETYDISYLSTTQQMILGADKNSNYKTEYINLKEGDKITLYTDGITEARNKNKEFYGENRLKDLYNNICIESPKVINEKIIDSIHLFSEDTIQFDDITILTLLYTNTKNQIKLEATDNDINVGKEFLHKFIRLYDMSIDMERNLKIVYDEIFSNIKNHAYDNKGGELIFKVNLYNKDTIEMIFMDKGPEFNPIGYKDEKTEKNIEEKYDGGMGLMFCKNIMDDYKYERKDGYNVLSLYKKFVVDVK